jgi:hypothetical protein
MQYLGLALDWNYKTQHVHLGMPGYIEKALARFAHPAPSKPQDQPHHYAVCTYGATIQYASPEDTSTLLSKEDEKYIQQVVGTLLYYG